MGGKFLLRIEDTDRARSTDAAIAAILDGLDWLDLKADGEITTQFSRAARHREAAEAMIARGTAFRCYMTTDEVDAIRGAGVAAREKFAALKRAGAPQAEIEAAQVTAARTNLAFRSEKYRDGGKPPSPGAPYVVRLRAPDSNQTPDFGEIVNRDLIQGTVRIFACELDDLVLLRADGNPTYMLSVVVDDHDMGVTHVIRGDDHLTNAARQIPIFQAMGWIPPQFAHLPLIHGPDGAKLSKRHGALAVQAYRNMGYLPEALTSYLMRLGWSPGHDDILTKEEAIAQFEIGQIGKGPARLDFKKLDSVNAHFMAAADDTRLLGLLIAHIETGASLDDSTRATLARAIPVLKGRAKTLAELAEQSRFLLARRPLTLNEPAKALITAEFKASLARLQQRLATETIWTHGILGGLLKAFATDEGVGLGQIGPGLRAALTGGTPAPDLGQALELLGREEALARISDQV